jgi:anti-anti-sigma regulatory factor
MHRGVAWLTLLGCLDRAGAQRLQRVLRTVGGLAPREVLVDMRDVAYSDGVSVRRLVRAGAMAAGRGGSDVVLVDRA